MTAILPGATIGILGGGQLGRMTAMAARALGYHIIALDPDPSCAARFVVDRCLTARFDDIAAAAELGAACDVVTLEIEQVAPAALIAASRTAPVRPGPAVLAMVQDRALQKAWLRDHGFPVGPYEVVDSAAAAAAAARRLGGCILKVARGGYDGRGQARVAAEEEAAAAFTALGGVRCVAERTLSLHTELSVLTARRPAGEVAVYPPAQNHHQQGLLDWSVLPGQLSGAVAATATALARRLCEELEMEGLLAVELFLCQDGAVLVNELAPRPHNSFHATEVGCLTSQFEQAVRAICDLPLGAVAAARPTAIANLLGDLWLRDTPPAFDRALGSPGVRLHLYGKRVPRPGRKMGHLSAIGDTPEQAAARVLAARALL